MDPEFLIYVIKLTHIKNSASTNLVFIKGFGLNCTRRKLDCTLLRHNEIGAVIRRMGKEKVVKQSHTYIPLAEPARAYFLISLKICLVISGMAPFKAGNGNFTSNATQRIVSVTRRVCLEVKLLTSISTKGSNIRQCSSFVAMNLERFKPGKFKVKQIFFVVDAFRKWIFISNRGKKIVLPVETERPQMSVKTNEM